ncbi:glutamate receptor ionotropic, delta-2-like [Cherax quadricarinatus]|uniref:glutamate receptor ionotropic, delta-2-like n=1 Tax=Cherax quadricarinatus TaxID=27406 RepID=UPI00387E3DD4
MSYSKITALKFNLPVVAGTFEPLLRVGWNNKVLLRTVHYGERLREQARSCLQRHLDNSVLDMFVSTLDNPKGICPDIPCCQCQTILKAPGYAEHFPQLRGGEQSKSDRLPWKPRGPRPALHRCFPPKELQVHKYPKTLADVQESVGSLQDLDKTMESLQKLEGSVGSLKEVKGGVASLLDVQSYARLLADGRAFLNGRHMVVATIERPPFITLTMVGQDITEAKGFCMEMLQEMAKRFNFTYKMVVSYDGKWGVAMPNGTYDGLVGMVQRKMVDFAVNGFTITQARETVIDFTHEFYEEPSTILLPSSKEHDNFLAFLEPFSWQVWIGIVGSILLVGPCLWMLANVGKLPVLYPHSMNGPPYPIHKYVWECAISLVMQNGRMRQTEPVRLLYGVWCIFSVVVIYAYTSTLIAFLTVPRKTNLINSLEELANQDKVLWTYRISTSHDALFSSAEPPSTYYKIGRLLKKRPDLLAQTDRQGLEAVLTKHIAFIKEKSWLDFAMEEDYQATKQCRLAQVNQYFFSSGFGWILQQNSIYLQLFNAEILKMAQSGLFNKWRQQYWPRANKCTAGRVSGPWAPKPLQLKNFVGHFFILGVGACLALLIHLADTVVWGRFWIISDHHPDHHPDHHSDHHPDHHAGHRSDQGITAVVLLTTKIYCMIWLIIKAPITSTKAPITSIKAPITRTKAPITSIKAPITSIKAPITSTKAPITSIKAPITSTKVSITSIKAPITSTKAPITSIKASITSIKAPITSTKAPITSMKAPLTSTKAPITSIKTPITSIKAPIASIKVPITNIKAPIINIKAPITSI